MTRSATLTAMTNRTTSPIEINERGEETHPSFATIRANRVTSTGTNLFDSEIQHREFVVMTVTPATRKRDLNRDWIHGSISPTVEVSMSLAQWGAFVSSFGDGSGVPVTLTILDGQLVPSAPHEPRMAQSIAEVQGASEKALSAVQAAVQAVIEGHEAKLGRREMGERLNSLRHTVDNAPKNMTFAAASLTEHVENVVTKAKADVEAMVATHAKTLGLSEGEQWEPLELGGGVIETGGGPT